MKARTLTLSTLVLLLLAALIGSLMSERFVDFYSTNLAPNTEHSPAYQGYDYGQLFGASLSSPPDSVLRACDRENDLNPTLSQGYDAQTNTFRSVLDGQDYGCDENYPPFNVNMERHRAGEVQDNGSVFWGSWSYH
jgi:hypothetical protein